MKMRNAALLLPCITLMACGGTAPPPDPAPPPVAESAAPVQSATAHVNLFGASESTANGKLDLTSEAGGVLIVGELSGLPPDTEHGFHVHAVGDCSAPDAMSAGDHLNPAHVDHGGPNAAAKHLGDLPNVVADSHGSAKVSTRLDAATLGDSGPNDLIGKAFVVHEKPDDYVTQPAGDSGARISCGVVR